MEEVEGIAAAHHDRSQGEQAPTTADGFHAPVAALLPAQRNDVLRLVVRQVRQLFDLDPELGHADVVVDLDPLDDRLAGLDPLAVPRHPDPQAAATEPGPARREHQPKEQQVAETQREPEAGGETNAKHDEKQDHDERERTPLPECRPIE
ncbi:MAG: hypothetical protein O6913_11065 [Chloroflexi bacterium]|nr:hypothetical protein [Chloroflexota bacterium]